MSEYEAEDELSFLFIYATKTLVDVSREDCLKTRSTRAALLSPTTVNWSIPETKIAGGGIPINFVQVCTAQGTGTLILF